MKSKRAKKLLRRLVLTEGEKHNVIVTPLAEFLNGCAAWFISHGESEMVDFVQSLRARAKLARKIEKELK